MGSKVGVLSDKLLFAALGIIFQELKLAALRYPPWKRSSGFDD
jgi:hypothetical protein